MEVMLLSAQVTPSHEHGSRRAPLQSLHPVMLVALARSCHAAHEAAFRPLLLPVQGPEGVGPGPGPGGVQPAFVRHEAQSEGWVMKLEQHGVEQVLGNVLSQIAREQQMLLQVARGFVTPHFAALVACALQVLRSVQFWQINFAAGNKGSEAGRSV